MMENEVLYRVVIEKMPREYLSVTISSISAIIALASIIIAYRTLKLQRIHGIKSVRPIIDILVGDYEDDIFVKLKNEGVGPAIIDELSCEYLGDISVKKSRRKSLIALLEENGLPTSKIDSYTSFVEDISGRTLPSNGEIILVSLRDGNMKDNVSLRIVLKDISIFVRYHDIYENSFSKERELSFFSRSFGES